MIIILCEYHIHIEKKKNKEWVYNGNDMNKGNDLVESKHMNIILV